MARVRNLKYENQLVEQPKHDGVVLSKWIHDGIVVWQNGGGELKDIHVIQDYVNDNRYWFVDATNKEIVGYSYFSSVTIGMCDTFLWRSPYGNNYWVGIRKECDSTSTDDVQITTNDKITGFMSNENKILFYESNTSGQRINDHFYIGEIDAENGTIEIVDDYYVNSLSELPDISSIAPNYSNGVFKGYANSINLIYYATKTHQEQDLDYGIINVTHNYFVMVKSDKSVRVIAEGIVKNSSYGRLSSINYQYAKDFYTNNTRILLGAKETFNKNTGQTSYLTLFTIINGDNFESYETLVNNTNGTDQNSIYSLKYDSSAKQYLAYSYFDNQSKIFLYDEEFNHEGIVDIPDYLDFEIPDGAFLNYTHLRLAFKDNVSAPDGYYLQTGAFSLLNSRDAYYDADGNIQEDNSIHFPFKYYLVSYSFSALIYIDNLYCQESEGNFLIPN